MNRIFKGTILVAIGAALIFPFLTDYILKIVVVVIGFYLVFTGIKVIFIGDSSCSRRRPSDESSDQG